MGPIGGEGDQPGPVLLVREPSDLGPVSDAADADVAKPVPLATIKADPELKEIQLIRRSRLSVVPLTPAEFERILVLGGTKLPKTKRERA